MRIERDRRIEAHLKKLLVNSTGDLSWTKRPFRERKSLRSRPTDRLSVNKSSRRRKSACLRTSQSIARWPRRAEEARRSKRRVRTEMKIFRHPKIPRPPIRMEIKEAAIKLGNMTFGSQVMTIPLFLSVLRSVKVWVREHPD
jgi:hypothetical protein